MLNLSLTAFVAKRLSLSIGVKRKVESGACAVEKQATDRPQGRYTGDNVLIVALIQIN